MNRYSGIALIIDHNTRTSLGGGLDAVFVHDVVNRPTYLYQQELHSLYTGDGSPVHIHGTTIYIDRARCDNCDNGIDEFGPYVRIELLSNMIYNSNRHTSSHTETESWGGMPPTYSRHLQRADAGFILQIHT